MKLIKTSKEQLTPEEILTYIINYESQQVPRMNKLWEYYLGNNVKILGRKVVDANNPDNKIAVGYGRKIINTFTGYAYRPRFITYKPIEVKVKETKGIIEKAINFVKKPAEVQINAQAEMYYKQIQKNYNMNNEHIKTSRAGRNSAIFGVAYENMYIDTEIEVEAERKEIVNKNEPKFFSVDPREMILLYDFSPEPKKKIAIRFFQTEGAEGIVEVSYANKIEKYKRIKKQADDPNSKEELKLIGTFINFFDEVPIVAYYFGDEMNGLIEPVIPLIDAYDVLVSDSMNEFDRFAFAYLIMKKFGLSDQVNKKAPGMEDKADQTIKNIKRKRMFEHLPEGADVSFLTKDIPDGFIRFMTEILRDQIHIQSHTPDFSNIKMAGASGIAIQRLVFDFENLVSSTEADFDIGLSDRMRMITTIYMTTGKGVNGGPENIVITHKRNLPQNNQEYADLAVKMKQAGFSRYAIADAMPDELIPDTDLELQRQDEDMELMLPDVEGMGFGDSGKPDEEIGDEENYTEEDKEKDL